MISSAGLLDLQVNGYAGVDFNDPALSADGLDHALSAMRQAGVTQCLPTLITANDDQLHERFRALDAAVQASRHGASMVPGYHLEGPFLNSEPGFAGCHPPGAMSDPRLDLVESLERIIGRPILLVTLAPERAGSAAFIAALRGRGIVTAMAHSNADFAQVSEAADAGLSLSTHLGNGLPQQMHKLDNPLLAQLAEPRLTACLIADGHHMSVGALKALTNIKGVDNCILVTDAVLGAAAPAGHYRFAGMDVERTPAGAMVQPGRVGLAGSALCLDEAIRNIVSWGIAGPDKAIAMASINPRRALAAALDARRIVIDPGVVIWDSALRPTIREP